MKSRGMEGFIKYIRNNNSLKRIALLIFISLMVALVLELWMFVPIPSKADNNSWLGFCGSVIGAILGGLVTLWGIEVTIKSTYLNVKPLIRPVRTNYYVYIKEECMTITDKKMLIRLNEFYKEEINFNELDVYMLLEASSRVLKDYNKYEIEKINYDKLYESIKEICKYKSNEDAFKVMHYELGKKYDKSFNPKVIEKIIYELEMIYINRGVKNIIYEEDKKWRYFMPLYNVGAGNALDIEVKWDTSDNSYKEYCDKLGFNDEDYLNMNKSFSLKDLESLSADILKIKDGEDKRYFEIPCQIMDLIEFIIYKCFVDNSKEVNTNPLLSENKIAQLKIKYCDIHGEEFYKDYDVLFKAWSNINKFYGYKEINFYFKFKDIDKKK